MTPETLGGGCPACGATGIARTQAIEDFEYRVRDGAVYATCAGCGSLYQWPMPDGATLSSYYPAAYHSLGSGGFVQNLRHDIRLRTLETRLRGPGAILDYGCGNGSFMVRASRTIRDRQFMGYEIGERPETTTLENGRVTIVRGSIDDLLTILPECAVISMNHVIEHLPDPFEVIARLLTKLAPGAWFEGQTPAAGSLEHHVFRTRWSGYHAPRHTVVFSPRGMQSFLARVGLEEVGVGPGFNPAGIAVSLASAVGGAKPGGIQRHGLAWMVWLGLATALSPVDFISGRSGMLNFAARRAG